MNRRRFTFWVGLGLFSLANKLRVYGLDELAAAAMRATEPAPEHGPPIHWRAADNGAWRWFERETFLDGRWQLSGVTRPTSIETGEAYDGGESDGEAEYLEASLVPEWLVRGAEARLADPPDVYAVAHEYGEHHPDPSRRARHGRPPSRWLRSLNADELRIWLKTIDPPEAEVSGMTCWEHLTRDHGFDPVRIEGLGEDEQAKLHAAAHYGY